VGTPHCGQSGRTSQTSVIHAHKTLGKTGDIGNRNMLQSHEPVASVSASNRCCLLDYSVSLQLFKFHQLPRALAQNQSTRSHKSGLYVPSTVSAKSHSSGHTLTAAAKVSAEKRQIPHGLIIRGSDQKFDAGDRALGFIDKMCCGRSHPRLRCLIPNQLLRLQISKMATNCFALISSSCANWCKWVV